MSTKRARQLRFDELVARVPFEFTTQIRDDGTHAIVVSKKWRDENLQALSVPMHNGTTKITWLHRIAAPVFQRFFEELAKAKAHQQIHTYDGGFVARLKRSREQEFRKHKLERTKEEYARALSNHSRGTAIDLNAKWNAQGKPGAKPDTEGALDKVCKVARAIRVEVESPFGTIWPAGIVCGADWTGASCDAMHFELGIWD